MRGSSGASFDLHYDGWVKKIGDARVVAQGQMLLEVRGQHLPHVGAVVHDGYIMEKLGELPWSIIASNVGDAIVAALEHDVWVRPPVVKMDHTAHARKMNNLIEQFGIREPELVSLYNEVEWDALVTCRTHGDPTADNLMLRADGTLVVIDPIPATPAVPDLKSVDMGKIMTSVIGFERARYGEFPVINSLAFSTLSANELKATKYWAVVHLLRALPYMPSRKVRDDVAALIPTALCF